MRRRAGGGAARLGARGGASAPLRSQKERERDGTGGRGGVGAALSVRFLRASQLLSAVRSHQIARDAHANLQACGGRSAACAG
jgi:hypothetical protein